MSDEYHRLMASSLSLPLAVDQNTLRARVLRRAHDALFDRVHSSTLIYNTCWEDPRLDREWMRLTPDSRVVMITSAGCNALDYLLDAPAAIYAIDVNPRQNALLDLKLALIRHGDPEELFRVFGQGARPGFRQLLSALSLPPYARKFWESKHTYFEPTRARPSFYYRGAAGAVAWFVLRGMQALNPNLAHSAHELVNAPTLPLQAPIFARFDAAFWNGFNTWLVQQPLTLAMLGVPRPQIRIIERTFPGGITGFIRSKMEYVFTQLPMRDNYFWRVYATGQYSPTCCPNYLRPENFAALQQRADHLSTHTMTVAEFLRTNPGEYSHYVLLDHQDWLASHDTAGLREEWDLILANSRPGTRILMRSASPHIDFLPAAARARLHFFPEQAAALHNRDRVGTYGSTLLAEVL